MAWGEQLGTTLIDQAEPETAANYILSTCFEAAEGVDSMERSERAAYLAVEFARQLKNDPNPRLARTGQILSGKIGAMPVMNKLPL